MSRAGPKNRSRCPALPFDLTNLTFAPYNAVNVRLVSGPGHAVREPTRGPARRL
jgi:hypothetical protein